MAIRKIGAHVSTAGGVDQAIDRVLDIGGNCVQVFSGSPRMWRRTPLDKINVYKLFAKQKEYGVRPIFTHALYLINIASVDPELRRKSTEALIHDLKFNSLVRGDGVVLHVGSHKEKGWDSVKDIVVAEIKHVLAETPDDSMLLIENAAGQRGKVNSALEEIRWLFDMVDSPRLGWCLDTCHAFAAGYHLGPSATLPSRGKGSLAEQIEQLQLWDRLMVIHVNDSRDAFNSGRDRHANLGEGNISLDDLWYFLTLPQVQNIPLILEVPGEDGNGPDRANITRLVDLIC